MEQMEKKVGIEKQIEYSVAAFFVQHHSAVWLSEEALGQRHLC